MAANLLKNDPSFVKMVVLTADHKKEPLTQTEAKQIEIYILNQICATTGKRPRFKGGYVFSKDDGAVIINTHVDSVNWLKNVIGCYREKALRITNIKNIPRYTAKVTVDVTHMRFEVVDYLLDLLEAHNYGLQTSGWRVSTAKRKYYLQISSVTFLIDDAARKMLEENDFKLFVGFSTLAFTLVDRVNRSETTGEICKDDVSFEEQYQFA